MEPANPEKPTSVRQHCNPSPSSTKKIEVWDLFVRFIHWALVVSFTAADVTGEELRSYHLLAGYAALSLISGRLVWGLVGRKYARFSDFVKSPAAVAAYVRDVFDGCDARYIGHNPAGGYMVIVLITLIAATSVSGFFLTTDTFWGSDAIDIIHGALADATLFCVAVHILGVAFTSVRTRENLALSMVSGRKRASADGAEILPRREGPADVSLPPL